MSAEVFGSSLLQEVHEESLSALLSDLQTIHTPRPESTIGLAELDTIIDTFRYTPSEHENFQIQEPDFDIQLHAGLDEDDEQYRDETSPSRGRIRPVLKPKPVIINIVQAANSSAVATSLLLSHLTARAILPPNLSGKYGAAVYIDGLNTFDAATLYDTTRSLIQKADPTTPSKTVSQLTRSTLSHVHIIPCPSTYTLLKTLKDLPGYLLNSTAHSSSTRPLTLLILTGLNHFTWQDRFTTELTRLNQIHDHQSQDTLPTQIFNELKSIQSIFNCAIVYTTNPANIYRPPSENTDTTAQAAQDIYTTSALLTLRSVRSDPPQFAPQMSLAECLRDRGRRMEAVRNVRFWFTAGPGGLSERRGRERMGFGMKKDGNGWMFES